MNQRTMFTNQYHSTPLACGAVILQKMMAACGCLLVSANSWAGGQTSANYAIQSDTINMGVADMTSVSYKLAASIGDAFSTGVITSTGYQLSTGFRAQTVASPAVLNLLSVVSRKFHGATAFSLTIDKSQSLAGNITVEPRTIGSGHTLVFHFDNTVTSVNAAATALNSVLQSAGNATAAAVGGNVEVTLTNVADNTRLTISLTGLNGTGSASASLGFLVGDVTSSHTVTATDIAAIKAKVGKTPLDNTNFIFDLNADGNITLADVAAVKARSGRVLPP